MPDVQTPVTAEAASFAPMIAGIRARDQPVTEQFYRLFEKRVRYLIIRQVGPEHCEDLTQDVFLQLITTLQQQNDGLRNPGALPAFVWTFTRRRIIEHIRECMTQRAYKADIDPVDFDQAVAPCVKLPATPEQKFAHKQRRDIALKAVAKLKPKEREILMRFYVQEQTQEEIQDAMGLTATQYRLNKNRAKNAFGVVGKKSLIPPSQTPTSRIRKLAELVLAGVK